MKAVTVVAIAVLSLPLGAQEKKPVPKDSVRVSVPGCTKGYIFTAGPRTEEHSGSADMPEGTHLRMNGPKQMMAGIKAHEGAMVEITGLMKKGQFNPAGVGLGGGVRMMPGPAPRSAGMPGSPAGGQIFIDVEGWRQVAGTCPSR